MWTSIRLRASEIAEAGVRVPPLYYERQLPPSQFTACRVIGIMAFFVLTILPCVICIIIWIIYRRWTTLYCDMESACAPA